MEREFEVQKIRLRLRSLNEIRKAHGHLKLRVASGIDPPFPVSNLDFEMEGALDVKQVIVACS